MKKGEEVMSGFIRTWRNMFKYQNVKINPVEPNYDDIEKAFSEEKKIAITYEINEKMIDEENDSER